MNYQNSKLLHKLVEIQTKRDPDSIAIMFENEQLTYRELNKRANQLAHYLQGLGVKPEVLVGLCVKRSLDLVVAMLGILKAGGGYVPLDPHPTYPAKRLAFMIEDAEISVIVTQEELLPMLQNPETRKKSTKWVVLDNDWEDISRQRQENMVSVPNHENLAYVIYTSGSTGEPKGVQITHSSVVNFLNAMRTVPGLNEQDTLIAVTTISFDISVLEIFLPLITGARCFLASDEVARDAAQLMALMAKLEGNPAGAVAMQATPSTWRMLLEAGWQGNRQLKALCGGEVWTRDLADRLLERCASVWNLYGPTEATVWVTCHRVEAGAGSIPIGEPITNTQFYILDSNLEPVPIGEPGELHISGMCLARGYLKRPELTAEKFIPNPFESGARLYKTGDLARYRQDGSIEFLGRLDHQVKIRGYRIELGEIETVLNRHPDVRQAVVTARKDAPDHKRLVAYLVANSPSDTENVTNHTGQWEKIWDNAYLESDAARAPDFHIGGWRDSYTEKDLDPEQVREWVEHTVDRVLSLQPRRLLEIGCGTGLLLFRIAPKCRYYHATDISREAIHYLERQISGSDLARSVVLNRMPADELESITDEPFDTVISNSVIQYFPNIDYLVKVIETAVELVESGRIFLGDVLSLPLLEAFHTSVQLYQAPVSLPTDQLRQRIADRQNKEQKLVVDPAFFIALQEHLPKIGRVEIQLKRGRYQNELTRFRYDVILHLGEKSPPPATPPVFLDWRECSATADVRRLLLRTSPEILVVTRVPNARIWADMAAVQLLASPDCPETVGEIRQLIRPGGIEPEDWWEWESEIPYRIHITWSGNGNQACYDVVFVPDDSIFIWDNDLFSRRKTSPGHWHTYANRPYAGYKHSLSIPLLRDFLQKELPDYMAPAAFVVLDKLPLTPAGKIDRRALPAPGKSRPFLDVDMVAPRTSTEETLAGIWAEVLNLDEVGILDNFFMLGGDSLQATQLISQVNDTFRLDLSLHRLFEAPTVAALSEEISASGCQQSIVVEPVSRTENLPLSFSEQRLWFFDQLHGESIAYNEQEAFRLTGPLRVGILRMAVQEIVRRHEILRTNFKAIDGSPVRVIHPERDVDMPVIDLQHISTKEQLSAIHHFGRQEVRRSFDLTNNPLIRVTILRLALDDHVLLLTAHHIIYDGWSTGVFCHELEVLYQAFVQKMPSPLPQLPIQYADFAYHQQHTTSPIPDSQLAYWKQQLEGAPLLELSPDHPRPTVPTYEAGRVFFDFGPELTERLKHLSREKECTLFMTLLAAFSILLYRHSNQKDIIVGTPIANRDHNKIQGLIGFFINRLALRIRLRNNFRFTELLCHVKDISSRAYANKDVPFERVEATLRSKHNSNGDYKPMIQVQLIMNRPEKPPDLPGVNSYRLQMEAAKAKYDLCAIIEDRETGLAGYLEYDSDLFEEVTARRIAGHFRTLLEAVVIDPQSKISELLSLTEVDPGKSK
uniref:Amino acid adenylation domain-containing protein n=1 Tax=Candidatus Kentrum sp. MB TaxID=2138164 RepID=A0A451BFU9_9GAMM|nr:MAG: amino acid adenylation domain-containing protein [Candidatus Kentron sp. MB]VFK77175.1 MAG: amino acid adenylation domain-containing protein [Candidatus Kentron sp. MB]